MTVTPTEPLPNELEQSVILADRFVLQKHLGQGGFGIVHHAFDQERGVYIALKELTNQSPNMFLRFKKEFRSLADISHPNLVTLHELIWIQDRCFFTMELIEGQPFSWYVREDRRHTPDLTSPKSSTVGSVIPFQAEPVATPVTHMIVPTETFPPLAEPAPNEERSPHLEGAALSSGLGEVEEKRLPGLGEAEEERLRHAFEQLIRGVRFLHSKGKLHCDLKPSNVLVTNEGRVVILDFGLVIDVEPTDFASSVLAGTPAFMPPEREPSEAADWYSVGVILYQALTGILPFTGTLAELIIQKQHTIPLDPRVVAERVPDDLADLCMELLQIEPSKRPSSEELNHRLGAALPEEESATAAPLFLGRKEELGKLEESFQILKKERSAMVLLRGQSGSGKSALVHQFFQQRQILQAEQTLFFSVRCFEQETMPYRAVDGLVDVLCHHLNRLSRSERAAMLPHFLPELIRLFPVLGHIKGLRASHLELQQESDSQELRRRAFRSFRELLFRISLKQPLVIFLDDLQWLDEDSARLLDAALRPPEPPLVLLILGFRSEDLSGNFALQQLIGKLEEYVEPDAFFSLSLNNSVDSFRKRLK